MLKRDRGDNCCISSRGLYAGPGLRRVEKNLGKASIRKPANPGRVAEAAMLEINELVAASIWKTHALILS